MHCHVTYAKEAHPFLDVVTCFCLFGGSVFLLPPTRFSSRLLTLFLIDASVSSDKCPSDECPSEQKFFQNSCSAPSVELENAHEFVLAANAT